MTEKFYSFFGFWTKKRIFQIMAILRICVTAVYGPRTHETHYSRNNAWINMYDWKKIVRSLYNFLIRTTLIIKREKKTTTLHSTYTREIFWKVFTVMSKANQPIWTIASHWYVLKCHSLFLIFLLNRRKQRIVG